MHLLRRPVLLSLALFLLGAPFRGGRWPSWLLVLTLAVLALDLMERTVTTSEWVPSSTFGGDTTAWTYGDGLPALGLLALLAWKGPGHPLLARVAPLVLLAPLGLWALSHLVENHASALRSRSSAGFVGEAAGPWGFLCSLFIIAVGVAVRGRRTLPSAPAEPLAPAP